MCLSDYTLPTCIDVAKCTSTRYCMGHIMKG